MGGSGLGAWVVGRSARVRAPALVQQWVSSKRGIK